MTDAPASCRPVEGTAPGTWHWLEHKDGDVCAQWKGTVWFYGIEDAQPYNMTRWGYRYHSPVALPDDLAALRRVVNDMLKHNLRTGAVGFLIEAGLAETIIGMDEDWGCLKDQLTPLGRRALGVEG
jgi:hypothetical protein